MFIDALTGLAFGSLDVAASPDLHEVTVDHVVDTVGALILGRATLGARLERLAAGSGLEGAPGSPADRRRIALVAGSAAHAWEVDDLHHGATICAGSVVLPALLGAAVAEPELEWGRFLAACRAGYDVAVAAGSAVGSAALLARGWWPTSLVGPLGAAAALAVAAGDRSRCEASLGIAAQQAGGSLAGSTAVADARYLLAGTAAERGVWADLAAASGWRGPEDFFDLARTPLPVASEAVDAIERPGAAIETAGIKRHPAAQHLQAAIETLLDLLRSEGIDPSSIERVDCLLPMQIASVVDRPPHAPSALSALSNGPFVLAAAAIAGRLTTAEYGADRRSDPDVLALASRIRIVPDETLGRAYPNQWGAKVKIFAGARSFVGVRASAIGSRDRRMDREGVDLKFLENVVPVLGPQRAEEVLATLREAPMGARAVDLIPRETVSQVAVSGDVSPTEPLFA